ncbi:hypothetical protein [Mucilaginibacter ginsenosidivorans]|uniref:Uncharacterized protein n=1 Tax=Mucilaginibacter ginsenosidivorans TaxID=398053 RepID=A0A5B8UUG1_9SPHI|nr:hypothetical protein [Mucilaginibacter ginsenosidivorans]QEC62694.1 hypothetical protein FRZ54_08880 [Mucilaginibacter ginsenosidivorans]
MEETELQNELASIRSIMERSSKFISLSGLSGILAGIYALLGAGVAGLVIMDDPGYSFSRKLDEAIFKGHNAGSLYRNFNDYSDLILKLVTIAAVVLVASIATALYLSNRQAKRKGQQMWGSVSRSLLYHMAVPLLSGGILILILLLHHHYGIVSATSLIFYGLALFSAGNFTFADVKYLGLCEIILGLIAACLPGHGLLFWALGFGVLHIVYGARIYLKYDR